MTDNLKQKLEAIGKEIIRVSNDKHTGNIVISISMRRGGIGRINVRIDKNLGENP